MCWLHRLCSPAVTHSLSVLLREFAAMSRPLNRQNKMTKIIQTKPKQPLNNCRYIRSIAQPLNIASMAFSQSQPPNQTLSRAPKVLQIKQTTHTSASWSHIQPPRSLLFQVLQRKLTQECKKHFISNSLLYHPPVTARLAVLQHPVLQQARRML